MDEDTRAERELFEQKEGKSIEELIKLGVHVPEELLKEHEIDLQLERKNKQTPKEDIYNKTFIEVNGESMPEFDERGISIDYDEE